MGRLVDAYKAQGAQGLISKKRGKRSNRAYGEAFKQSVLSIVRQQYADFGPTLATEKLRERHEIKVSEETIRQWMIDAGLWADKAARLQRPYQPRHRRDCFGELIQIDGSDHRWFEDRGPRCCLLVYIDDATSRLVELRFCTSETTFDYMQSTQRYLIRHGKPVAFYSDKHSVFRVNQKEHAGGVRLTQFGRALADLNIDIIYANSSQAKGRVERMNKTLQDRLVKEMRLQGINTMEDGNAFLPHFLDEVNNRFAKEPANPTDLHRALTEHDDLVQILCWQEQRTVSNSLTVQYDRVLYILKPSRFSNKLRRDKVTIFDYPDGMVDIKHNGVSLPYSSFDKVRIVRQSDIVSNKRLGAVLAVAKEKQDAIGFRRRQHAPAASGRRRTTKPVGT